MARRNEGAAELLVTIVSQFPWWIGVVLALLSYISLHHYAYTDIAAIKDPSDVGAVTHSQLLHTFALIGQYSFPPLFLLGALLSFMQQRKRKHLFEHSAGSSDSAVLNDSSWQDFELLVGEAFRRKGYSVRETGGGGADGGVDLVITKESKTVLVQCKQWKNRQVGVKPVRELAGLVAAKGAAGGIVVSSGSYTDEAQRFAKEAMITLINGAQLHKLIRDIQIEPTNQNVERRLSANEDECTSKVSCPKCGKDMVQRIAKRGSNAGKRFFGCADFPRCRGVRTID